MYTAIFEVKRKIYKMIYGTNERFEKYETNKKQHENIGQPNIFIERKTTVTLVEFRYILLRKN